MDNLIFLDFEADKKNTFFCASKIIGGEFEQVILNSGLHGLAHHKKLRCITEIQLGEELLESLNQKVLVAYSLAELNYLKWIFSDTKIDLSGMKYCNLNKAFQLYINQNSILKDKLENLSAFRQRQNTFERKLLNKSLASKARVLNLNAPTTYAPGKTSTNFKQLINALSLKDGDFKKLTRTQKMKATNCLQHNKFDVEVLVPIYHEILTSKPDILRKYTRAAIEWVYSEQPQKLKRPLT